MGTPSSARRKQVNSFLEKRPCLLYWGDSWFSTPLYMNLAKQSMSRIDGMAVVPQRTAYTRLILPAGSCVTERRSSGFGGSLPIL